jgi:2-polyprenyl-6-methoxyphenol hydroxylase-like FAD-dependent oxidoreductase
MPPEKSASAKPTAAVIGGSMSGLFASLLLRQQGWQVDLYEQSEKELAGRGAGIITHEGLNVTLEAIGLALTRNLGVPTTGRRVYGRDGSVIASVRFPQTNTSWDRLFDLLRKAFPVERYHLGKKLVGLHPRSDGVGLSFADGSRAKADLVVGADGIRSAVRAAVLPGIEPLYAGYVAWRGLTEESELPPAARAELFDSFVFCLPPGEQMLGYPVAGPGNNLAPGHRRFNFVWYRPAAQETELKRLLTDDHGRTHHLSIPPPLIRKSIVAEMRVAAERVLAPLFAEAIRKTPMPFLQPIYDLAVSKMAFGRIVLIGDAAFVARPHVGAGVTKAAEDALALARSLAAISDVAEALRRFEVERLPVGRRIIERARHLGSYMQAQLKTPEEQAAAERHRSPEAVMLETASVTFLEEPETAAKQGAAADPDAPARTWP